MVIDLDHFGDTCGVLPVGEPARVKTTGLKWDLGPESCAFLLLSLLPSSLLPSPFLLTVSSRLAHRLTSHRKRADPSSQPPRRRLPHFRRHSRLLLEPPPRRTRQDRDGRPRRLDFRSARCEGVMSEGGASSSELRAARGLAPDSDPAIGAGSWEALRSWNSGTRSKVPRLEAEGVRWSRELEVILPQRLLPTTCADL